MKHKDVAVGQLVCVEPERIRDELVIPCRRRSPNAPSVLKSELSKKLGLITSVIEANDKVYSLIAQVTYGDGVTFNFYPCELSLVAGVG